MMQRKAISGPTSRDREKRMTEKLPMFSPLLKKADMDV